MSRSRGFTLIEVLVALVVMSVMAIMAWRGLDTLLKSRDIAQAHLDQSTRLQTVVAQWEQDLRALQDSGSVSAFEFDGATLRFTRQQAQGMQLISWSVRDGGLYRWAGPVVQRVAALSDGAQQGQDLRTLDAVVGWQMYCYRVNSWSNCLSSADAAQPAASGVAATRPILPTGVRMVLQFGPGSGFSGPLTRQIELWPQS